MKNDQNSTNKPALLAEGRLRLIKARLRLQYVGVKLRYFRRDFALRYLQFLNRQGTALLKAIIAAFRSLTISSRARIVARCMLGFF